eukprot:Pgem_evm1s1035
MYLKMRDDPEVREENYNDEELRGNKENNENDEGDENAQESYQSYHQSSIFRFGLNKFKRSVPEPMNIGFPLTLCSIGVTVWDIGKIYTGENPGLYWSTSSCKHQHPYPVGYKASKIHFGRMYDMEITASEDGPVFSVKQRDGKGYSGQT